MTKSKFTTNKKNNWKAATSNWRHWSFLQYLSQVTNIIIFSRNKRRNRRNAKIM